ncbi:MAG: DNA replication and repair protein RecF [Spirosomaceae bacterium]|nr:DNA replication and repair protein RecF [Spirosomataceae bacterium]
MHYLKRIYLLNFRNYEEFTADFSPNINCIVGENGSGKTNLLDAVYYLGLTKSSIQNQDALSIRHDTDAMMIDGLFDKDKKQEQITCSMQRGQRKVLLHDRQPYERISEHIGKYPVVLIGPDDTDLIRDSSDTRRRFFDGVISQMNPEYLSRYQHYNRVLDQRNSLLKQFADQRFVDDDLLDIYSEDLLRLALEINSERRIFVERFLPIFAEKYAELSESREAVNILYNSEVTNPAFIEEFRHNKQVDLYAQRTTKGIHRDDYEFKIDTYLIKKFGSQGQKKAYVMALRLAQFELLRTEKQTKPILLLDDVFDKLDDRRINKIIESINDHTFGQIFLTAARPERTATILKKATVEVKYFKTS